MELPKAFEEKMKALLGDEFDSYTACYKEPRYYGLRVNTAKISVEEFVRICPFAITPVPWIENGFYYNASDEGSGRPSRHPYYYAGLYYLQEPSAMAPASLLPVEPGDKVLDLCAAPGGKSTELAAKLQGEGLLFSNDISNSRAKALLKNLELAGCYYQEPMSYPALLSWCEAQAAELWPYIVDTGAYLEEALKEGKRVVLEAQLGAMRDIDYGIFPYTSSSSTISAYGPIGAGIPGKQLDHVVGVLKAYSTCVGAGPFTAEKAMPESWMELLRKFGGEYGAATGRPRRVGPFDAVASRYGLKCQNADKIALTKLDVLSMMKEIPVIVGYKKGNQEVTDFDPIEDLEEYVPIVRMLPGWQTDISGCVTYDELPDAAKTYVETLEDLLQHEIQFISVGAERSQYLTKGEWL